MAFVAGSRSCIESLRNDLRTIQGGLKELVSRTEGLQVPSWRFPEKLSTSLEVQELVKGASYSTSDEERNCSTHILLLEIAVDRLLLLLQSCLRLSDQSLGHRSSTLPLTIGSAVKKFSKRFLQDTLASQDMKKQVTAKDEQIASMGLTITKLEQDCQQLREALHNSTPSATFTPSSRPTTTGPSPQSRPTTSAVPYEAEATLRLNRLSRSVCSLRNDGHTEQGVVTSASVCAVSSIPVGEERCEVDKSSNSMLLHRPPPGVSVSTQTTDTAFALCARCAETHTTLVSIAVSLSGLCSKHQLPSTLATTDWETLASVGGLELNKWEGALERDLASVDSYCDNLENRIESLSSELALERETIGKLETESKLLSSQIDSLQESIEQMQRRSESSLSQSREVFTAQLRRLEAANRRQEGRNRRLAEELNAAQQQEAHLRALMAELEHRRGCLQEELQRMQGQEMQLLTARNSLETDLACLRGKLEDFQEELGARGLELRKTRAHNQSLEKRNKSLQAKHSSLLSRLEELDQECSGLREELGEAVGSQEELLSEVQSIQRQCSELQNKLEVKQSEVEKLTEEHQSLSELVSRLEGQLGGVRVQLQEETHNCRLLMDFPFLKQTSDDYSTHIASLSGRESQKQISANTIRILLLEEQNSELRHKTVAAAQSSGEKQLRRFQLKQPTQLWQRDLLSKAQEELQLVIQDFPKKPSKHRKAKSPHEKHPQRGARETDSGPRPVSHSSEPRPPSSSRLRGRLGHLISAIEEAHRASSSVQSSPRHHTFASPLSTQAQKQAWLEAPQPQIQDSPSSSYSEIEVHVCTKCDRMYHSKVELERHQVEC